jgi:YD repeat-containing protein
MFRPDGALAKREHENPDGSSSVSIFSYDDSGRLTFATIRNGNAPAQILIYEWDAAGRLTRITSERGKNEGRSCELEQSKLWYPVRLRG